MTVHPDDIVLDRQSLLHQLARQCDAASNGCLSFSLVLVEISRLGSITRVFGNRASNEIRIRIEQMVDACFGQIAGWIDQQCFAVVLPSDKRVCDFTEQLTRRIEQPLQLSHRSHNLQMVCGSAQYPGDAPHFELLLTKAESALNAANSLDSSWVRAEPCQFSGHAGIDEIETELERALMKRGLTKPGLTKPGLASKNQLENELSLHYQPKVDLQNHRIVGVEALARWRNSYLGQVNPAVFIPLAERTGLIHPLTDAVVDTAVSQSQIWPEIDASFSVALNLSTVSLTRERLPALLKRCRLAQESPIRLVLEITESVAMKQEDHCAELLQEARSMGAAISLDDFGTGYSSLSCLQAIPADEVKLDQAFVRHLNSSPTTLHIARLIIDLAHALDMRVVAEGVEDRATMDRLADLQCDQIQGYFAARPMPAPEFRRWLGCYRGMGPAGPILQSHSAVGDSIAVNLA